MIHSARFAAYLSGSKRSVLFALLAVGLPLAVKAQTIPNAPSDLTASAVSNFQISLSWTDNATNEDGFTVERSLDGTNFTQIAQVSTNTTNYLNSGLFPNTTYSYRVRAYNSGGNSDYSDMATAGTPAPSCPLSVVGWGDNDSGQATPPSGLTGVVAIAGGFEHSLALKSDGTAVGWGYDYAATPPVGLTGVVAIAAGAYHSLALQSDATVVGWGENWAGQATPPAGLSNVVAIAGGYAHSLALKSDGTVVGWGTNVDWNGNWVGQATTPAGLSNVVAVAAGALHSLALKSDGTVVDWGTSWYGATTTPAGLTGVVAAAGGWHGLALKSDATVVAWGANVDWNDNWYGQATTPAGLTGVVAIAAGWWHSLALTVVPNAPSTLTATAVAGNQVNLSWVDNSATEDGFKIERATDAGGSPGSWAQIATNGAGVTFYSDTGATTNTTYWYRVRAYNTCGDSPHSDQVITSTGPPAAPSNLTAAAVTVNEVDLSWTDNSNNEGGFKIERAPDAGGSPGTWAQIATNGANVTTYSDMGVTTNTAYWYRVRAYNSLGDSPYSNLVFVNTAPPPAPSSLNATAIAVNEVDLSWVENYADVNGFKIERALDAAGSPGTWTQIATNGASVTAYSDRGVTTNTTYWYRVQAYNALGDSPYSDPTSATIVVSLPTVILDDTWSSGIHTNQNLPTSSAWWTSSRTYGPLSSSPGTMTMRVTTTSSAMIMTYFTPNSNSPPVRLNVGDTLTATFKLIFDGIPTAASSSIGFKIGLFDFADSTLNPKRVSSDSGFSSGTQGNNVQGYALFGKMYTTFADTEPIEIMKRTDVAQGSLLGASAAWTALVKGGNITNFPGFANLTPYSLQMVLQRTNLNSMAITMTWSNMANGATLSMSTADNMATNFSFDGIAYRPQNITLAPATNMFKEVRIELASAPVSPSIITQPQDQSVPLGQTATFTVVPNGTLPLFYQWYYNSNAPVANATNSMLPLINVQLPDLGGYSVIVSNSYGSVTSVVAQLTVDDLPPFIATQPQDLTVIPGQTATFTVDAGGSKPLSYQWYYNTNTLLTGAIADTLTLTNVQLSDAGSYSIFVSNAYGSVISSNAILTVGTGPVAPVFITQPASLTAWVGSNASFTAVAIDNQPDVYPISYQWNRNGAPIPSATASTLNLTNVQWANKGNYTATASNSIGSTNSDVAVLTVRDTRPTPPDIPTNSFIITNTIYAGGALGDGISNSAAAIQATINAAAAAGGGSVIVPSVGTLSTYLSGPFAFSNNINLQIDSGAMLKMLPRTNWPGTTTFITVNSCHDVEISGSGTIDGNAGFGSSDWWPNLDTGSRPYFINFSGACTNVLVRDVTLQNPPKFHLMLKGNNVGVTIHNITINTPANSPNTDGMDLASTNVLVENCSISCGDDNIEIGGSGGPAADITVSNCTFGTGHGVSIGSDIQGGVHDLLVSNCTFNGTDYGIRMKSDRDRGGLCQNLQYRDISMTNVGYAIVIYSYYNSYGTPNNISPSLAAANGPQPVVDTTPIWRNITISNLTVASTRGSRIAGIIWGRPEMLVSNVTLYDVNILAPTKTFDIYNARGIQIIDSQLTAPSSTNTLTLYNAEVTITNSVANTNLVTLSGLANPPTNNVLAFFNAQVAITDTNMLGSSPITLGGSTLTFTQGAVSFSNNLSVVSTSPAPSAASTLAFTSGGNLFRGELSGSGQLALNLPASSLLTLQGDSSGYSGALVVSNSGTLLVNNIAGSGTGAGAVTVVSGATLGGNGIIGGPVTVDGALAPGNSVGTLTISNSLVVNSGAVLQYDLGAASDLTVVDGNLTLDGTLNITDAGGFTNGTYTLFSYGGTLTDNGMTIGTVPDTNIFYVVDTSSNGYVRLHAVSAIPPVASFTGTPTSGTAPLPVTFTDSSSGTITNRYWNFGDGNTTNTMVTSLSHTYAAGTYIVSLTASGPAGSDTSTLSNYVVALTPGSITVTPASYGFGLLATGTTAQTTFVVANTGGTAVTNGTATMVTSNTPFSVVSNATFSVAGFGSTNVVVRFAPVTSGAFTNNVAFNTANGGVSTNMVTGAGTPDLTPPTLTILNPTDYEVFNTNRAISVSGTASDASGIAGVTVNGATATLSGTNWSRGFTLLSGTNTITVIATDNSVNRNVATQIVHAVLSGTFSNRAPVIVTPPVVTNALLQVDGLAVVAAGDTNTFSVGAVDPDGDSLSYIWSFGDGVVVTNALSNTAEHVYTTNCGPYTAGVSVSDGDLAVSSNLTVAVACQLTIIKMQVKLNFAKANADSASLSAVNLDLGAGFGVTNKVVRVDIGGTTNVVFTLDANGRGVSGLGSCKLTYNKKTGTWGLTAKLVKGSWQTVWASYGLVNADLPKNARTIVTMPVIVVIGDEAFAGDRWMLYTAKAGKSGSAN